ncbi:MAG TPA: hypothetical protein VHM01_02240 [Alphaproteobacteria bacterium]|nr:hypothetical protein [Alphaproteobacteria bacterium]
MNARIAFGMKLGLSRQHATTLARLRTPQKIQDFVSELPTNFEPEGDTCLSVAEVLRQRRAHCIEGAFVAACALWMNGEPPLLMDFQATLDDDHVIALFRRGGCWGAISKSNHIWLRWRDPVYRTPRELAMSYFHEYVWRANKSLRRYSRPFDLRRFDPALWVTNKDNCWDIAEALDECRHYTMITPAQARMLRPRDRLEVEAGKFLQFEAPDRKTSLRY